MTTTMLISKEVCALCRFGRTTLHNRLNPKSRGYDQDFPRPVKLGARCNCWIVAELEAYLAGKAAKRTNLASAQRQKPKDFCPATLNKSTENQKI